jgi:probable HAF family extracellular repeat protein
MATLIASLTLSAALGAFTPAASAQQYQLINLGTLGGSSSFALDINNLGQITGNAQTPLGEAAPRLNTFLWNAPGPMLNLGVLPGSNNFSRGYAINDAGTVVGEFDNNTSRAFIYASGTLSGLTRLAGDNDRGVAHDINNNGLVVGISSNGVASRATLWTQGQASDLGSVDGLSTTPARAWGLNDAGSAVGLSRRDTSGSTSQATLWRPGQVPLGLGSLLPDSFSQAYAINASGVIVGSAVAGQQYLLDAIVTMVDAKHAPQQLDEHHEAQEQVGFADRILITKTDVVQPYDVAQLRQRLVKMNPRAKIAETHRGVAAIDDLLDIRGFNLNAILEIEPDFLTDVDHEHDDDVTSFVFREGRPLSLERVEDFLSGIVQVYGTKLMRYKGVLSIRNVEQRIVFQGVHMLMGSDIGSAWKPGEKRDSKMVFIGRDMPKDVLLDGLAQCVAGPQSSKA